jgi:hypothetical protein
VHHSLDVVTLSQELPDGVEDRVGIELGIAQEANRPAIERAWPSSHRRSSFVRGAFGIEKDHSFAAFSKL